MRIRRRWTTDTFICERCERTISDRIIGDTPIRFCKKCVIEKQRERARKQYRRRVGPRKMTNQERFLIALELFGPLTTPEILKETTVKGRGSLRSMVYNLKKKGHKIKVSHIGLYELVKN